MNENKISLNPENRQSPPLTPEERRLLLGATLRLLGHRFILGKPISKDDVLRAAWLGDDVEPAA